MNLNKTIDATVSRVWEIFFSILCQFTANLEEIQRSIKIIFISNLILYFYLNIFFHISYSCQNIGKKLKKFTFFLRLWFEHNRFW